VRAPNFSFTHHSVSETLRTYQSATTDPRAEELVGPHRLTAHLAVDDGKRGEGRTAGLAAPQELAAALRAGVGQLCLELLEPAARSAATEAECDPVSEDLPTLLPQPIRRLAHALTIAAVVTAVAGCGGGPGYHSTRDAKLVQFTVHSRAHKDLHEILVVPRRHGDWMLVLLHGYHAGPSQFLTQPFFDTLAALGARAPEVLLLDGGADSYWHDRDDGRWGSMVLREAIPAGLARTHARRVAIGGISMGGYGALLSGSRRPGRLCAVGAQSPALWLSAGETAPGAFDDAQDYERNDVFKLKPPHPLWIDLGASDPFRVATLAYAKRARIRAHLKPGGHDAALWNAFTPQFLRFFARACA
jgi:pimeloyl-ACP methyl ester carboxylesterase